MAVSLGARRRTGVPLYRFASGVNAGHRVTPAALQHPPGLPVGSGITMEIGIIIVVIAVVVLVGIAFVARGRRDRGVGLEPPAPPRPAPAAPPEPVDDDLVAEVEDAFVGVHDEASRGTIVEAPPEPEAPAPPAARPSFRDRLAKARGALGGYLGAIRSRKVDDETWDELEEALIRADVGVAATQRILDDLRRPPPRPRASPTPRCSSTGSRPSSRPGWPRATASLRYEPGGAQRVAVRRRQRRGQDHHHRQGRPPAARRADARWSWPPATPSAPPRPSSSACGPSARAPRSCGATRAATRRR